GMRVSQSFSGQRFNRCGGPCCSRAHGAVRSIRPLAVASYLVFMPKRRFEPCLPARQTRVPTGADWIHEIKQDGYRLIVQLDALHSGRHNDEVQFYAFDMLAGDGEDLRKLPLSMRKANLQRLLARRPEGIFIAPFEQGEIGPDLFRKACEFGLER